MSERTLTYFVSDVHLGLDVNDPVAREARFLVFLNSIPGERTEALYLLGDIWDFWYEYHDVVPKGSVRVLARLMDLISQGVKVYFFRGNHDMWSYSYFESLGMIRLKQPYVVKIAGKTFCIGHGDGLGKGMKGYKFMRLCFRNPVLQFLFSLLHPWIAFRIARCWSKKKRTRRTGTYTFAGESEPLYQYALKKSKKKQIDYFVFGHYHTKVDLTLPTGARLLMLDDWIDGSDYLYFDGIETSSGQVPNIEK